MPTDTDPITIRLGHSPDPDDAFMWWPLIEVDGQPPQVDTGRFRFETVTDDIESLNTRAVHGELDITAISCAQYPQVKQHYALTACGASLGDGYGPKLVARQPMTLEELAANTPTIAVPGRRTSAYGTLAMMLDRAAYPHAVVPFDQIIDRVSDGAYEVGLVIHEGQLMFEDADLHLLADLGVWWQQQTTLPLPLGGNAIRRNLEDVYGAGTLVEITRLLRQSVEHAMAHRDRSLAYAMHFARDITPQRADEFVAMYVNRWTLDFAATGREAVTTFLQRLHDLGVCDDPKPVDFIAAA
jgi:1,4-dihydroxy-6-naphthoate synthase